MLCTDSFFIQWIFPLQENMFVFVANLVATVSWEAKGSTLELGIRQLFTLKSSSSINRNTLKQCPDYSLVYRICLYL